MITQCHECRGSRGDDYRTTYSTDWVNCGTCKGEGILFNGKPIPDGFAPLLTSPELYATQVKEVRQTMLAAARLQVGELEKLKKEAKGFRYKSHSIEFDRIKPMLARLTALKDDVPYYVGTTMNEFVYYGREFYRAEVIIGVRADMTLSLIKQGNMSIIPSDNHHWKPEEQFMFFIYVMKRENMW